MVRYRLLPRGSVLRLVFIEFSGLLIYFISTFGTPLHYIGLVTIPSAFLPYTQLALALWFGFRAYTIGKLMGWKHGLLGALASYITVTLNFIVHAIGILKGDPKRFEVIKKKL